MITWQHLHMLWPSLTGWRWIVFSLVSQTVLLALAHTLPAEKLIDLKYIPVRCHSMVVLLEPPPFNPSRSPPPCKSPALSHHTLETIRGCFRPELELVLQCPRPNDHMRKMAFGNNGNVAFNTFLIADERVVKASLCLMEQLDTKGLGIPSKPHTLWFKAAADSHRRLP
jgi:hypothetical protein